jgi:hypothetical protein
MRFGANASNYGRKILHMNMFRMRGYSAPGLVLLVLAAIFMLPLSAGALPDDCFEVLQIGTKTYKNVTVTTKARDYIFILHSTGMANIKVSDLTPSLKDKLGYSAKEAAEAAKAKPTGPAVWAKQTLSKLEPSKIKDLGKSFTLGDHPVDSLRQWIRANMILFCALVVLSVPLHFLMSYAGLLICRKTSVDPGLAIWIPVLQLIPLLRAANMSPGWFLAYLIPVVNVLAYIVWCAKISQARGKTGWVTVFLLLPITTFFAFLYLGFSGTDADKEDRRIEIMTLEAA